MPNDEPAPMEKVPPLSIVAGGLIFQLESRLGLVSPDNPHTGRRALFIAAVTWVPCVILSALIGRAAGSEVRVPFLHDAAEYTRLLITLPLLVLAEGPIGRHMTGVAAHFVEGGLVPDNQYERYTAAVTRARNFGNSTLVGFLVLLVTAFTVFVATEKFPFDFTTWRSTVVDGRHVRTLAGWWALLGLGLMHYLSWLWLWRLAIWYRFLRDMLKLDLRLIATHPDNAGGLAFVGDAQRLFWMVVVAWSAAAAGVLGNEVIYKGAAPASFTWLVAIYVLLVLLIFLGPLLMCWPTLWKVKVEGEHAYAAFAIKHHQMFNRKWILGDNPDHDSPLGAPDISSLADLDGSFSVLRRMRPVPFDPADAGALVAAALLPMSPLALAVVPLNEVLDTAAKLLF
jgi:hypothetical protein